MATTRTHRVDDRVVVPLAAIAGVVAALGPAEPTGSAVPDAVIVAATVAVVTWLGATARWWALVVLAVAATAIAGSVPAAVAGAAAVVGAVWIGTRRRDLSVARAAVVAVALNVAIRSDVGVFLGLSAIITIGASLLVVASGLSRRHGETRRRALIVLATVAGLAAIAFVGAGIAFVGAGRDLRDGNQLARDGISMLGDGDYAAAADRFDQAASSFASSNERMETVWSKPSSWLPIIAQQRSAATKLSASAEAASQDLAAALRVVDPEQLRLVGGRFDLDAIAAGRATVRLRAGVDRRAS